MAFVLDHRETPEAPAAGAGLAGAGLAGAGLAGAWRRLVARARPAPASSPWGAITEASEIAPGILWFRSAARGGYRLSPGRQRALPHALRTADNWYEDGVEWAAVAVIFGRIFDKIAAPGAIHPTLYHLAKETLKHWFPEEYESWFQTDLEEDEIAGLAVMRFHNRHAGDWIALEAFDDSHPFVAAGCLHVRARLGGDPPYSAARGGAPGPCRWFLVDAEEFTHGRGKPFLIDLDRHPEIDAPYGLAF